MPQIGKQISEKFAEKMLFPQDRPAINFAGAIDLYVPVCRQKQVCKSFIIKLRVGFIKNFLNNLIEVGNIAFEDKTQVRLGVKEIGAQSGIQLTYLVPIIDGKDSAL